MAVKARELEGMTKAELIKALRASVAREAKLQKRIAALEGDTAALRAVIAGEYTELPPLGDSRRKGRVTITHVDPATLTDAELHAALPNRPAFPWEQK